MGRRSLIALCDTFLQSFLLTVGIMMLFRLDALLRRLGF